MKTNKLKAKIVEKSLTQGFIAKEMGIASPTLNQKINDYRPFTREELLKIKNVLELSNDEFLDIFFLD